jgi:glycosyltransferase involved in cell wall biosynthesis
MNVLASAYCCSPFEGSEHYAGHHFISQIGRRARVRVLVPAQLRSSLERWPHRPSISFEYLPTPLYVPWEQAAGGRFLLPAASYYLFSLLAYRAARRLARGQAFDVSHHLTIANYRFPSLLPFLGNPSVLGPLGGGEEAPLGLDVASPYSRVRGTSLALADRDPVLRASLRRARRLLVANVDTGARLGAENRSKLELMMYGFDAAEMRPVAPTLSRRDGPFTILCVSRLVRHKAVDLLVRAAPLIAEAVGGALRVLVFGEGSEASRLDALARSVGADRYVRLAGRVGRADLLRLYGESDAFCLPSLRDTCPVALLEAMAAGLPVVVLDVSGPGHIVDDRCGIRVRPSDRPSTVAGLADALAKLGRDREFRRSLGEAGRARVLDDFSWDSRGDRLAAIYAEIREARVPPPSGEPATHHEPSQRLTSGMHGSVAASETGRRLTSGEPAPRPVAR